MLDFYSAYEKEDPEFVTDEELIEGLLHGKALTNLDVAFTNMDSYLGSKTIKSIDEFYNAMAIISPTLSVIQNSDVDIKYLDYVDESIYRGSIRAGWGKSINYAMSKEQVKEGIVRVSGYYTNKYFNEQVIPKLTKAAQMAIDKKSTSREVYDQVRASIDDHYGSVRYWNLVANSSASRAYHYGLCKGGQYAGYSTVRYSAVMDNRTSAICRNLNGTEWQIQHVVDILERASTGSAEDWEQFTPWLKASDYDGMTQDEMVAAGVIVPPRHGRCRSVLELI